MRQGSNPKRLRGRNGRKNMNPRSQSFESNGPEVKVRGNAQQVVEKYLALARDATSAGDRIMAESYFQHAEHYYRLMTANGSYDGRDGQGQQRQPGGNNYEGKPQPAIDGEMERPEQASGAAPVTNGADTHTADPASAPQPDAEPDRAAQVE